MFAVMHLAALLDRPHHLVFVGHASCVRGAAHRDCGGPEWHADVGRVWDGRFELYKTTAGHEGEVGRKQHGFPSPEEVAL